MSEKWDFFGIFLILSLTQDFDTSRFTKKLKCIRYFSNYCLYPHQLWRQDAWGDSAVEVLFEL